MKYIILILFFFLIYWYYKKNRESKKNRRKFIEREMKECRNCGVYFHYQETPYLDEANKRIYFCSEKCYKEFLEKRRR